MRSLALALAVLILAVGVVDAADDSAIMQFASGVLAGSLLADESAASIDGDILIITSQLSEYSDGKVGSIGYSLWNLASSAEKIIDQYPGRFKQVDLKMLDSSGNNVIGMMSIAVQG
ncbi:MAG: hypothetical protein PHQ39_11220 [Methanothrix soehngenii]|jgi:hypothetical protein|nr:hypothetical protein [Methanothrix soehngenii]